MILLKFAGCNRFVWNVTLGIQKERIDNKLACLSYSKMCKIMPDMKSEFLNIFIGLFAMPLIKLNGETDCIGMIGGVVFLNWGGLIGIGDAPQGVALPAPPGSRS